jgi:hypothetical protein
VAAVAAVAATAGVAAPPPAPAADLSVAVVPAAPGGFAGRPLGYALVVANAGPAPAPAVRLLSRLPAGAALISARPIRGRCSHSGSVLACDLGTLGVGRAARVAIRVLTPGRGVLPAGARAASALPDPERGNDAVRFGVTVGAETDLAITAETLPTGAVMLRAANLGPGRATGVTIRFRPPPTATVRATPVWSGRCRSAGGTLECDLGAFGRGGVAAVTLTTPGGGAIVGRASVRADQPDPRPEDNRLRVRSRATS